MLTKNNSLKLDRSNWKLTKLGDLALEILKRTDNPSKLMFDRFVGLDNFRPGDITIKNWQSTKNIISAAKEFGHNLDFPKFKHMSMGVIHPTPIMKKEKHSSSVPDLTL